MIETDIGFCGDLLREVGEQLVQEFTVGVHSRNMTDMFRRFNEANGSAAKKMEQALLQKFPNIRWSDAEFDIGQPAKS